MGLEGGERLGVVLCFKQAAEAVQAMLDEEAEYLDGAVSRVSYIRGSMVFPKTSV